MRILVLTRYHISGPSSRLRFYQYVPYLEAKGIELQVVPMLGDDYISALYHNRKQSYSVIAKAYINRLRAVLTASSYDLLWIEKEIFPWLPAWAEQSLSKRGIPYVVDYDDAVFHRYDLHRYRPIRTLLGKKIDDVMRHATTVVVGNDYLVERAYSAGAQRIKNLPTVIDIDRYPILEIPNKQFRIGWIGSPITTPHLGLIKDALTEAIKKTGGRLVLIGAGDVSFLSGVEKEVLPWSEDSEVKNIHSFDVGIMPLPDEDFERGKCGYKIVQYMACGKPVIASPVGANTKIVENGITGLLASSNLDWINALVSLFEDAELRRKFGEAGRKKVEKEYCLQITAPQLLDILEEAGSHGIPNQEVTQ